MVLRRATKRAAFTLTEMMVATALTLFLMAIISAAFRAGLDTFSKLNTANAQQQKLSNIKKIVSRDLGADHFEGPYLPGFNGPKISDQRLNRIGWRPPAKGYVTISQNAFSTLEPSGASTSDGENLYSTRSESCFLSFTMKNPSTGYADQFAGRLKAQPNAALAALPFLIDNTLYSPWAQVHYFLANTGEVTDPGPGGTQLPLYSLRRQLFVLAPDDASTQVDIPIAALTDIKNVRVTAGSVPNTVRLVSPTSVQTSRYVDPSNPLTALTIPIADPEGDDILLVDVLSFEVKVWWDGLVFPTPSLPGDTGHLPNDSPKRAILNPPQAAPGRYTNNAGVYPPILNSAEAVGTAGTANAGYGIDWPFTELPSDALQGWTAFPRTFDTWFRNIGNEPDWDTPPANNIGQPPLRIRVKALQIKVRIWDRKSKQTRQVTFIQEV